MAAAVIQKPRVAVARMITIGTKTADTRSASRCTSALPVWAVLDHAADLRERRVGADAGCTHDERPVVLTVAPVTMSPGNDVDGHRLAGQQRGVDGRRTLLDDTIGGDLLAGAHDEEVADDELVDGDSDLGTVQLAAAEDGHVLGAQLEERFEGGAGPTLGTGLEVAAGEDEDGDPGGDLEVDLR